MDIPTISPNRIIYLPGRPPAMLDRHVAEMYGLDSAKRINERMRRNLHRLPEGIFFIATEEEREFLATFLGLTFTFPPYLYTELGCRFIPVLSRSKKALAMFAQVLKDFVPPPDPNTVNVETTALTQISNGEIVKKIGEALVQQEQALVIQKQELADSKKRLGVLEYRESSQKNAIVDLNRRVMSLEAEVYKDNLTATEQHQGVIYPLTASKFALSVGVYSLAGRPHAQYINWLMTMLNIPGNPEYGRWRRGSAGNIKDWLFYDGAVKKFLSKKLGPNPWNWPNADDENRWKTRIAVRPKKNGTGTGARSEAWVNPYIVAQNSVDVTRVGIDSAAHLIRHVNHGPFQDVIPPTIEPGQAQGYLVWTDHPHKAIQAVLDYLHKYDSADVISAFCALYSWDRIKGKPVQLAHTHPGIQ